MRLRNTFFKPRALLLLSGLGALSGCSGAPHADGLKRVQIGVAERTGHLATWRGDAAGDAAADTAVRSLLQRELSADSAVEIALLNNRRLQATLEDVGIAQAELVQAGLLKNPVFDLGVRIPDRRPFKTYLDFAVAESFLDAFLIPARRKLAGAQLDQTVARVSHQVLTLAADTESAFYRYQGARQSAELSATVAQATSASADAAEKLHEAGNVTDLDYTSQQAQDAKARVDGVDAETTAADAREKLNELMGLWGQATTWTAAPRLADPPVTEIDPHGLETLAVRQRLDLAAARSELIAQGTALGLTRQTRLFADADVGIEAERETEGQWRIGPSLSVPIPLFDQGQATLDRAQAQFRQSRERYAALAVDVRSQVRAARTRLFNARAKAIYYRDTILPLQRQLLRQTQLQFNGMFVGVFQLLQAKRDQIDAARGYVDALRDYWVARAELQRAIGGRLPEAAPMTQPSTTQPATAPSAGTRAIPQPHSHGHTHGE